MTKHLYTFFLSTIWTCASAPFFMSPAHAQREPAASTKAPSAGARSQSTSSGSPAGSGTSPADIEGLFSDDQGQADATQANDRLEPDAPPPQHSVRSGERTVPAQGGQGRLRDITDLGKLEPLKDIAVIQKRYLPKTGRFEFYLGASDVMNDVFFANYGLSARLSYYFQERYGIEFVSLFLTNNPRQVVSDLSDHGVATKTFVAPKSFYGLDFKWSPIYGKMTWRNKRITPFDMYFSAGGGITGTNQKGSAPTLHLATGQVFAITKGMAFRWDLSWNFFNTTSTVSGSQTSSLYNNLLATLGVSFFFPEATYR